MIKSCDEMNAEQRFAYDAGRASLRAELEAAREREKALREALEYIRKIPRKELLLTNAEARAMYEVALRAIEGAWGKPYEEAALAGEAFGRLDAPGEEE